MSLGWPSRRSCPIGQCALETYTILSDKWKQFRTSSTCNSREKALEGWAVEGCGEKGHGRAQFKRKGSCYTGFHSLQLFPCCKDSLEVTHKPLPSLPNSLPLPFQKLHFSAPGPPDPVTASLILVCLCFVSAAQCLSSLGKRDLPKEVDSAAPRLLLALPSRP